MNINNKIFDLQSLRTLNTPHQHSRRDNISAMQNIVQRLKTVETRQKSHFAHRDERTGLIALGQDTFTVHAAIKDYINTCISDASTTITDSLKARDAEFLKDREYAFYEKQVTPSIKESLERDKHLPNSTHCSKS